MNVAMICDTVVKPRTDNKPTTREDITCNIQYAANGMSLKSWANACTCTMSFHRHPLP